MKSADIEGVAGVGTGGTEQAMVTRKDKAAPQRPTVRGEVASLFKKEGVWGFYRGLLPRIAASSLFGPCMIVAYEFCKKVCAVPER